MGRISGDCIINQSVFICDYGYISSSFYEALYLHTSSNTNLAGGRPSLLQTTPTLETSPKVEQEYRLRRVKSRRSLHSKTLGQDTICALVWVGQLSIVTKVNQSIIMLEAIGGHRPLLIKRFL